MPEYRLSDAELYLMSFFWAHGSLKSDELAVMTTEKGWKTTTLLTFLSRLAAKGMLEVTKQGKSNLYSPLVSRQQYSHQENVNFINEIYGGSTQDFLAAMVTGRMISKDELEDLSRWLEEQEV